FSTLRAKLSSTAVTSSRDTLASWAMAAPTRCTSLAAMCLSTCAAPCSPSVMRKIAARSVPLRRAATSLIAVHPVPHPLRHPLRILRDEPSRLRELLLVADRRRGCRPTRCCLHRGERRAHRERAARRGDQALEQGPHHQQQQDN